MQFIDHCEPEDLGFMICNAAANMLMVEEGEKEGIWLLSSTGLCEDSTTESRLDLTLLCTLGKRFCCWATLPAMHPSH